MSILNSASSGHTAYPAALLMRRGQPRRIPSRHSAALLQVSYPQELSYKVCILPTYSSCPHRPQLTAQCSTGVGVGNASASPTSALLLHILQDSSGRVATILFAHRVGTALEPECKTYRLAADVFNDSAMILDCLSPMIPAGVSRVTVLSAAGVLRALCGVAGGSSKASLSAHFSKWGNLAEVNAVRLSFYSTCCIGSRANSVVNRKTPPKRPSYLYSGCWYVS